MHRPRQFGPYTLIRRIAAGGMAEIFLARTQGVAGFEKYLALKMIRENFSGDEEFVEMLINEAKIAVRLHHHNIVQVFDLGRIDGRYFIAMEYIDGRDLQALLVETARKDIYVPWEAAAYIVREACAGLHYAHTRLDESGRPLAIVHRDVSPQNVLLGFTGDVKLADFGIAKANIARSETQVGVIKGKFCYMSPEQAWGDKVDNRSDVFSIGVVLYELLTGEMLYQEEEQLRLLDKVRRAQIPPPTMIRRDIPSDLEAITMMALERDRKDRFVSGAALQLELTRYLAKHAPHYGATDLQRYLREIFGVQTTDFEREIHALDPRQQTRAAASMPSDPHRSHVMARADFLPSGNASLVHDVSQLHHLASNPSPLPEAATTAPVPVAAQDSTRPIRLTAAMASELDDAAPTKAHSRAEIDAILSGADPRLTAMLAAGGGGGGGLQVGGGGGGGGIRPPSSGDDDDPTMLYGADSVRDAIGSPNDATAPMTREQVQQAAAHFLQQRGGGALAPPLAGPEQAADGSWDPRSEAILLASADLEPVDAHHLTPAPAPAAIGNTTPRSQHALHHPLEHAALGFGGSSGGGASAQARVASLGGGGSGYRPQASLLPPEQVARYVGARAAEAVHPMERARTIPLSSHAAIRRSQSMEAARYRHAATHNGGRRALPHDGGSSSSSSSSSWSMMWILAAGLLLLGILAVLIVLLAG